MESISKKLKNTNINCWNSLRNYKIYKVSKKKKKIMLDDVG